MSAIIFDTETTGLPTYVFRKGRRVKKLPHMLQLSWILYNYENCVIESSHDHIIRLNDDVEITEGSIKVHKITPEIMKEKGEDVIDVLKQFNHDLQKANYVVAHNIKFDLSIIQKEYQRNGIINYFDVLSKDTIMYCSMLYGNDLCKIMVNDYVNGGKKPKYPRLEELHYYLFKEKLTGLHDAFNDVLVCLRCFCKMIKDVDIMECDNQFRRRMSNIIV